ncbi:hypothetical protein K7432_004969 [Basidiobolus ranarum]|uniref:F-box domain-containing protein n=1 Tax=Basidiobolus ranarum TaxID=34480 RepID=A0ABR2WXB3_9FUNG
MAVFPFEVLELIFYHHSSPQQLISANSRFYRLSKENKVRANWLWNHQNFFELFPEKTSSLAQPHALVTPTVAIFLLRWCLQNLHRLLDTSMIEQFLSKLNFRCEFDPQSKLESENSKEIEELGILLVQVSSLHSDSLMTLLFEDFNLSRPAFLECVLEQIEVGQMKKCRRTALQLIISACSYRKDKVQCARAKLLGVSLDIFTERELNLMKSLEEHPDNAKEKLLKTLQHKASELYLFCLYDIPLELEEAELVKSVYGMYITSLQWLIKYGDPVTQDTIRTSKKLLPVIAGMDVYYFGDQLEVVQFMISQVYHVKGQLRFEGFTDMLKDAFRAACSQNLGIAEYLLHTFSLQFNTQDKKKIQQWIIEERSSEAFKYIRELDLNASEMLRHLLSKEPDICCSDHVFNADPTYVEQLYSMLEESGANIAEILSDIDIGNTLVAHPWFLLPTLGLIERNNISISAAEASILLSKTLTSIRKYIDRRLLRLDEVELELLSSLVDRYGARVQQPFFPSLEYLDKCTDEHVTSVLAIQQRAYVVAEMD